MQSLLGSVFCYLVASCRRNRMVHELAQFGQTETKADLKFARQALKCLFSYSDLIAVTKTHLEDC